MSNLKMDKEKILDILDEIYTHLFNLQLRNIVTYKQYSLIYNIIKENFKEIYPCDDEIYKQIADKIKKLENKKNTKND